MKKSELSKMNQENDQIFISSRLVLHLQLTSKSIKFIPGLFPGFPGLCMNLRHFHSWVLEEWFPFSLPRSVS